MRGSLDVTQLSRPLEGFLIQFPPSPKIPLQPHRASQIRRRLNAGVYPVAERLHVIRRRAPFSQSTLETGLRSRELALTLPGKSQPSASACRVQLAFRRFRFLQIPRRYVFRLPHFAANDARGALAVVGGETLRRVVAFR